MCIKAININKKMLREQHKMQKYIWCAIYIKFEHKQKNTTYCLLINVLLPVVKKTYKGMITIKFSTFGKILRIDLFSYSLYVSQKMNIFTSFSISNNL